MTFYASGTEHSPTAFGLLICPVAGAITGELLRGANLEGSVCSGFGALVGLLAGIVADFVISLVMVGLFL